MEDTTGLTGGAVAKDADEVFKKVEREEEENIVDQRILYVIGMLIVANYLNHVLSRPQCKLTRYVQGEFGLAMIIGIIGGFVGKHFFDDTDIKDFFYEQTLLFRLILLPPIVYET